MHLVLGPDGLPYLAELWWAKGLKTPKGEEIASHRYGRVSILDTDGRVVARIGGGPANTPCNFTGCTASRSTRAATCMWPKSVGPPV